jgi:hypothetical protein
LHINNYVKLRSVNFSGVHFQPPPPANRLVLSDSESFFSFTLIIPPIFLIFISTVSVSRVFASCNRDSSVKSLNGVVQYIANARTVSLLTA